MTRHELTQEAREVGLANGADLVGFLEADQLPEHADSIDRILPDAQSVVVVAARHALGGIGSANIQMAQFDTMHTYDACARAAHRICRFLESRGYLSVAVPAFIPIDLEPPKKGMRGEVCWRRAGVRAGLGSYGENGLLVTREFGAAVRLAGLLSTAPLVKTAPLEEDICDHCGRCLDACPAGALSGNGKIDKRLCGDEIFKYGYRFFARFMQDLAQRPASETAEMFKGHGPMELWQTFMTGNYYYCFQCQSQCPATQMPQKKS